MATIRRNFDVDLQSHHIVCNPTDRSRGFTMGGETPTVILTVRRNSPAAKAGLQNGDYILQIGTESVHMFNSEGVERVLATMSHRGFDITVAHVSPWPRNLTEKKYAISKIKHLWEMKQKTKWGPLQVDKNPGQVEEEEGTDTLTLPTDSGVSILRWNEGADVDFSAEFDSDEEPPPSDDDEMDDGTQQVMEEWMELFKDGKKMAVVKGKVKGKVAPRRDQDWANVQSQVSQTAAPPVVSRRRGLNSAFTSKSKVSSSSGDMVQVTKDGQISSFRDNVSPHKGTPPHQGKPARNDLPHRGAPHHHSSQHQKEVPHHVLSAVHASPSHAKPHQPTPLTAPPPTAPPPTAPPPTAPPPTAPPPRARPLADPTPRARPFVNPTPRAPPPTATPSTAPPPTTPLATAPPSSTSPNTAGSHPWQKHQKSLSPRQQQPPPKLQPVIQSASSSVADEMSVASHVTAPPPVSVMTPTAPSSTNRSRLVSQHRVTPERMVLGGAGTAMQNAPHSASKQQRQLVRVLQKDHEDKAPNHTQPVGMHNTVGSTPMKKGAEPKYETVQRVEVKKRSVSPEPTQQTPQHTVSASHPQSQGGARAGYLELAGLREKQQVAVTPNVAVQEPEFATLGLPFPVSSWTTTDVCQWLRQLCPELHTSYTPAFCKCHMTGKNLMQVSKRELLKMGASSVKHVHVLWRSIEELREYEAGLCIPDLDEGNEVTFL